MTVIELTPTQRVTALQREIHSREYAYVLVDKGKGFCVLSQRLPVLQKFLSETADPHDPPSLASLYEVATAKLRCGYVHRKWRVIRTELDECANEFERQRRGCAHAIVLAHPRHLKVES